MSLIYGRDITSGTDLCLFVQTGSSFKCIALATTCKLSISHATRKIASKDSGIWEQSAVGRLSWSVDSDNLFTQDFNASTPALSGFSYDSLLDLMISRTPITVTMAVTTTSGMGYQQTKGTGKSMSGLAIITKLDLNAPDNDNASFTVTLEGTGELTHV